MRPSHQASNGRLGAAPGDRAAVALLELGARVAREVRQHVVVEVAPAELAAEGLRAPAARSRSSSSRARQAAEVQVRREARGAVAAERVVIVRVAATPAPRKRSAAARASVSPPARRRRSTSCSSPSAARDGIRPLPAAAGSGGSVRGAASTRAGGRARAMRGGRARRPCRARRPAVRTARDVVDRVEPRMGERGSTPASRSRVTDALAPAPGERARRRREKCTSSAPTSRASVVSSSSGRPRRTISPEPRSRRPRVEIGQALEQELGPRPRGVSPAKQAIVEAEHRHHAFVALGRAPERGMVVHAEVTAEPEQRRHRGGALRCMLLGEGGPQRARGTERGRRRRAARRWGRLRGGSAQALDQWPGDPGVHRGDEPDPERGENGESSGTGTIGRRATPSAAAISSSMSA